MIRGRAWSFILLLITACASSPKALNTPLVTIRQISTVAALRAGIEGGVPVDFRLNITNPLDDPLTLTSVEIETLGLAGAYSMKRVRHRFTRIVPPHGVDEFDFRAWVVPLQDTERGDVSTPVILRGIAHFSTVEGKEVRTSFSNRAANP